MPPTMSDGDVESLKDGARDHAAMERALRRIESLQRVTEAALAHLDLDDLLRVLLERTTDILHTDTAAILLLDDEGTTLAARAAKGLEEEVERGFRLPIGAGFAGRVAATRSPVVINDLDSAAVEPVNPLFRERGVRALLGVPLIVERTLIGVLHVGALSPREWNEAEIELLQLVADRIALAIERDRLYERNKIAGIFQRSVLPSELPDVPGLVIASRYLAATTEAAVGGDWYDVIPYGDTVGLAIGDVVGHGVEAVALMNRLRTAVRAYTIESAEPAEVATRLARFLHFEDPSSMATFLYCRFDPERGQATIVNAGHPPPLLSGPGPAAEFIEGVSGQPLGISWPARYEQFEVTIPEDSALILYTDGLVERRGSRLRDRLAELAKVAGSTAIDAEGISTRLTEAMLPEDGPTDDVAVLVTHNLGSPAGPLDLSLRARPEVLAHVRRVLRAWLRRQRAGEREISAITLAVSEACANAIEHAYGPSEARFRLQASIEDGLARIEVHDEGSWREPRGQERGRGIMLMRTYMDVVDIKHANSGTTVAMEKAIEGEEAG
jgi:anti-sigma regulatory factor (Ser/Thr protein kinase)